MLLRRTIYVKIMFEETRCRMNHPIKEFFSRCVHQNHFGWIPFCFRIRRGLRPYRRSEEERYG